MLESNCLTFILELYLGGKRERKKKCEKYRNKNMAALDQYLPPNISTHEEMISDRGFRLQTLLF